MTLCIHYSKLICDFVGKVLAFSAIFCLIKSDLSGNPILPQTSGFQNGPFLAFLINFCEVKLKT